MSRGLRVLLMSIAALALFAHPAAASGDSDHKKQRLDELLGAQWETVFELPVAENPFTGGDPCLQVRGTLAPLVPLSPEPITCTVDAGTKVFVAGYSSECSTVEAAPFVGSNERELRRCARRADAGLDKPEVTVDGRRVTVHQVTTDLLTADLPPDNVFGVAPQRIRSVAHGWVALLDPLAPGTHEIVIHNEGVDVFGNLVDVTATTTIIVEPDQGLVLRS